ncbi:MAG: prepilin-type N-terminal cleavage/methylation domain-containing protein [Thermodesulfobacteriota bacterium]|jgi:prepilin-type N-terminal cleavage/methylation domain-containing protein
MSRKFHRNPKGFTLVELMIVTAVIGILTAIAIPQYNLYRVRGFMVTTRCDTKNVHTAVQAWIAENVTGTPPAETCAGPGQMVNYSAARVSAGVIVVVAPGGDVTGRHVNLNGTYTINVDGSVNDTLAP